MMPKTWESSCPALAKALAYLSVCTDHHHGSVPEDLVAVARAELTDVYNSTARAPSSGEFAVLEKLLLASNELLLELRKMQAEREKNPKLEALAALSKRRADELETNVRRATEIIKLWKTSKTSTM